MGYGRALKIRLKGDCGARESGEVGCADGARLHLGGQRAEDGLSRSDRIGCAAEDGCTEEESSGLGEFQADRDAVAYR